ncbi:MAG TPA: TetR/AcrR family transcriptional regulator [Candidatus Aquilonibacter sp.]|nr:TetR/AcrR family transcriptional regulator [Candidatus Aquilonibacter sp.]
MIEQHASENAVKSQADQTRDRIIAAAREVIGRKGKRGSTTREIADVAGVNEATLFRHFGNKESLIVAVAKASCPDARLREVMVDLRGPIEEDLLQIGLFLNKQLESMIDMIKWSLVESDYEEAIFSKEAWRPQTAVRQIVIEYLQSCVDAGTISGDPSELATIFMGTIFARIIARDKFPGTTLSVDPEYATRLFVNVFLNGVRSK